MTQRYAVIGNPIAQSRSPEIHAAFARQLGHDLSYERLLASPETFTETVRGFVAAGGRGMNVTAPFKLQAYALADTLTERARAAQAVNTLRFGSDGILGDNTDGVGLVNDIQQHLGFALAGKRVLVIGAGGAVRGILLPILQAGPARVLLINRTVSKAQALVHAFGELSRVVPGEKLSRAAVGNGSAVLQAGPLDAAAGQCFDVVLQATSAGLKGQGAPLADFRLGADSLAYDLAYAAEPTFFMRQAMARGAARVADGLGMLVGQAAESYRLWWGVSPDVRPVLAQLEAAR
ncbi:shikimate dehydrogenase [Castellaniella caeni]